MALNPANCITSKPLEQHRNGLRNVIFAAWESLAASQPSYVEGGQKPDLTEREEVKAICEQIWNLNRATGQHGEVGQRTAAHVNEKVRKLAPQDPTEEDLIGTYEEHTNCMENCRNQHFKLLRECGVRVELLLQLQALQRPDEVKRISLTNMWRDFVDVSKRKDDVVVPERNKGCLLESLFWLGPYQAKAGRIC